MKNCSFTGHRQIENAYIIKLEEMLSRAIDYVYSEGCRTFFCGGALGFDTMAAKAVISKRILHRDMRLVIVIPCKNQSESWSERAKLTYDYILSSADEVIYVADGYTADCMRKRNLMLAESCDVMIAFASKYRSGAGQTVRMAQNMNKTVYNLYKSVTDASV